MAERSLPEDFSSFEPVDITAPNPNNIEFDNLYLDLNGVLHNASHPEHREPPKNEEEMMKEIMRIIDRIFAAVRPRNLLYLAIDGVAPRAKMNQQRSRRFLSAQEREQRQLEAIAKGESLSNSNFDSNCITPGTEFMRRTALWLSRHIAHRINTQAGWKKVKVILSDSNVPGEGEHKIMKYIRTQRTQPDYDPNMRHVIYGLDADLVLLTLATHEPLCYILRERQIVQFNTEEKTVYIDPPFELLDIQILRTYLEYEFMKDKVKLDIGEVPPDSSQEDPKSEEEKARIKPTMRELDLERIVDDFVLLSFLVGNDFLPHLAPLRIREGALDVLLEAYKKVVRVEYLTVHGDINMTQLQSLLRKIAKQEDRILIKRFKLEQRRKVRERKEKKKQEVLNNIEFVSKDEGNHTALNKSAELADDKNDVGVDENGVNILQLAKLNFTTGEEAVEEEEEAAPAVEDDEEEIDYGKTGWKERYYYYKFNIALSKDPHLLTKLSHSYIEGLAWSLKYYFYGCCSWKWFYPYHYGPLAQDVAAVDFSSLRFEFTLGTPFPPLFQLMAVLPPTSSKLLPVSYQPLMDRPELREFYPKEFKSVSIGAAAWHKNALLPFIEEELLVGILKDLPLNAEETIRNTEKRELMFLSPDSQAEVSRKLMEISPPILLNWKHNRTSGLLHPIEGPGTGTLHELLVTLHEERLPSDLLLFDLFQNSEYYKSVAWFSAPEVKHEDYKFTLLDGIKLPKCSVTEFDIVTDIQRNVVRYNKAGLGAVTHNRREANFTAHPALWPKVDASSKGYALLTKLGWQGGRLGKNEDGLLTPVEVEIRHNTRGLCSGKEREELQYNEVVSTDELKSESLKHANNPKMFTPSEIRKMLQNFREQSIQSGVKSAEMRFPAGLDNIQRAQIHVATRKFKELSSKSYGAGAARHIVITFKANQAHPPEVDQEDADDDETEVIQSVDNINDPNDPNDATVDVEKHHKLEENMQMDVKMDVDNDNKRSTNKDEKDDEEVKKDSGKAKKKRAVGIAFNVWLTDDYSKVPPPLHYNSAAPHKFSNRGRGTGTGTRGRGGAFRGADRRDADRRDANTRRGLGFQPTNNDPTNRQPRDAKSRGVTPRGGARHVTKQEKVRGDADELDEVILWNPTQQLQQEATATQRDYIKQHFTQPTRLSPEELGLYIPLQSQEAPSLMHNIADQFYQQLFGQQLETNSLQSRSMEHSSSNTDNSLSDESAKIKKQKRQRKRNKKPKPEATSNLNSSNENKKSPKNSKRGDAKFHMKLMKAQQLTGTNPCATVHNPSPKPKKRQEWKRSGDKLNITVTDSNNT